jgi:hypothetical protein
MLSPESRRKAVEGLGLNRVRVCGGKQLYDLILEAASKAIAEAGITARDINLILDFSSSWSGEEFVRQEFVRSSLVRAQAQRRSGCWNCDDLEFQSRRMCRTSRRDQDRAGLDDHR